MKIIENLQNGMQSIRSSFAKMQDGDNRAMLTWFGIIFTAIALIIFFYWLGNPNCFSETN